MLSVRHATGERTLCVCRCPSFEHDVCRLTLAPTKRAGRLLNNDVTGAAYPNEWEAYGTGLDSAFPEWTEPNNVPECARKRLEDYFQSGDCTVYDREVPDIYGELNLDPTVSNVEDADDGLLLDTSPQALDIQPHKVGSSTLIERIVWFSVPDAAFPSADEVEMRTGQLREDPPLCT